MIIKNTFCELKGLTSSQVGHLQMLMPDTDHFDFFSNEILIGFEFEGDAGTWEIDTVRAKGIVSYGEMLSLLGVEEKEKPVPHIHQKEIIAWANGEEIEVKSMFDKESWFLTENPLWRKRCQYRVKEGLSPTQLRIAEKEKELSSLKYQDAVERGVNIVLGEVDASN